MEDGERTPDTRVVEATSMKKQSLLNKFLTSKTSAEIDLFFHMKLVLTSSLVETETYHMIETCDPTIACWSDDGHSFVIKDVKEFAKVRPGLVRPTFIFSELCMTYTKLSSTRPFYPVFSSTPR